MMYNMITDLDIDYVTTENPMADSIPLVWIIDGDCLYDNAIKIEYKDMFLNHDSVIDVSEEYNETEGIVVRFIKNNTIINDFKTSEYFGSILLSNPDVVNLLDFAYGRYVVSPYAKFDGDKFIILNQDTTDLLPWYAWDDRNEN